MQSLTVTVRSQWLPHHLRNWCFWCLSLGTRTENNFLAAGAVRCVSALPVPQYNTVEVFAGLIHVGTRAKLVVGGSEEVDWRRVKAEEGGKACDSRSSRNVQEPVGTTDCEKWRCM